MSRLNRLPVLSKVLLGFSVGLLFTGCAEKPVPPVFSLYGYQRLAVVPFDNQTQDPALAGAVANEMTEEVVNIGALPLIQSSQVAVFLKEQGASPEDLLTNDRLRKSVGKKFQCDILLMGSADGYDEFLKDTAPQQSGDQSGFYTNRKVIVNASAKLVDVTSGSLLWSDKNKGWSWYNTWNPLPVPIDEQIMAHLGMVGALASLVKNRVLNEGEVEPPSCGENPSPSLIYPKSHYFNELRQKAIYQTINGIVDDFRGHCGWTPQLRGTAQ